MILKNATTFITFLIFYANKDSHK